MTHSAKRIGHGHYEYRGYQIEEVGRYGGGYGGATWNITHNSETEAQDATSTLSDAKWLVDNWEESGG